MLKALRLIRLCDHKINEVDRKYITKTITRSSESPSDIIDNSGIESIDSVFVNEREYTIIYEQGIDFKRYTHNKIIWISPDRPQEGTEYEISYISNNFQVNTYDPENCPRCSGMGWYASVIDSANRRSSYVTGVEKLSQDIIKMILTDRDDTGYGTSIARESKDYNLGNEAELMDKIKLNISNVENYYKDIQASIVADGVSLNPEEILRKIEIEEIFTDINEEAVIVSLIIYNDSLENVEISIKV